MRAMRFVLLLVGIVLLLPTIAWSLNGGEGLANTAHDFTINTSNTIVGLCTFCHTPHKALSTLLLWNHTLSQNEFKWDIPTTTAGTTFATFKGDTYKGPTAKCLSCHDGSVAVGNIAWFNEGKPTVPLDTTFHSSGEFNIASPTGSMAGNHPVAMPYPYSSTKSTYNLVTNGAQIVLNEFEPDPTILANSKIRLFNDDGAGNITAGPVLKQTGMECSSCHDPHNKASVDDLFLRGKLTGNTQASGYICLQCHLK